MSGVRMDFEVAGATDKAMGAVIIAGVPIASDLPTDGKALTFFNNQFRYETIPIHSLAVVYGLNDLTPPVAGNNVSLESDFLDQGTDITRASIATFNLQPGLYHLTFGYNSATFDASGSNQEITYQFFNVTDNVPFGPIGEASGFDPLTTSICGASINTLAEFQIQTTIAVRILTVSGTNPSIPAAQYLNILKLD